MFLNLRSIFDDPAVKRGMIDGDTPLAHHLLQLPIRNRVCNVSANAPQNDLFLEMATLEIHHRTSNRRINQQGIVNKGLNDNSRFATEPVALFRGNALPVGASSDTSTKRRERQ